MAIIQPPATPPTTAIWYIGWYLDGAGRYMSETSTKIVGVPILGQYLSTPFYYVGWYLNAASDYAFKAEDLINHLQQWLDYIITSSGFKSFIRAVWGEYDAVTSSPVDWLKAKLVAISVDLAYLWLNQGYWINKYLRTYFPWIGSFLDDAGSYIVNKIRGYTWWLPTFFDNPSGFVLQFLKVASSEITLFLADPAGRVIVLINSRYGWFGGFLASPGSMTVNWLKNNSGVIYSLLNDPALFIRGYVQALLGVDSTFWSNPMLGIANYVINLFSSQMNDFGERLKDLAITVILRFI